MLYLGTFRQDPPLNFKNGGGAQASFLPATDA